MSQYQKACTTCKQQIEMSDKNAGKWLPFNLDGTLHNCRNQTQTGTKKVEISNNNNKEPEAKAWIREILEGPKLKEIEARLKRVESIVIGPKK